MKSLIIALTIVMSFSSLAFANRAINVFTELNKATDRALANAMMSDQVFIKYRNNNETMPDDDAVRLMNRAFKKCGLDFKLSAEKSILHATNNKYDAMKQFRTFDIFVSLLSTVQNNKYQSLIKDGTITERTVVICKNYFNSEQNKPLLPLPKDEGDDVKVCIRKFLNHRRYNFDAYELMSNSSYYMEIINECAKNINDKVKNKLNNERKNLLADEYDKRSQASYDQFASALQDSYLKDYPESQNWPSIGTVFNGFVKNAKWSSRTRKENDFRHNQVLCEGNIDYNNQPSFATFIFDVAPIFRSEDVRYCKVLKIYVYVNNKQLNNSDVVQLIDGMYHQETEDDEFVCKKEDNCGVIYNNIKLPNNFHFIQMEESTGNKYYMYTMEGLPNEEYGSCVGRSKGHVVYQVRDIPPTTVDNPVTQQKETITKIMSDCVAPG